MGSTYPEEVPLITTPFERGLEGDARGDVLLLSPPPPPRLQTTTKRPISQSGNSSFGTERSSIASLTKETADGENSGTLADSGVVPAPEGDRKSVV